MNAFSFLGAVTFIVLLPSNEQILKLITMKSIQRNSFLILAVVLAMTALPLSAQRTGNANVIGKTFEVSNFTGVDLGGAIKMQFTQADEQSVYFETDENLMEFVKVEVKNNVLNISVSNIRNATKLSAVVTAPFLNSITTSGAAYFEGENEIQTDLLKVEASGASRLTLNLTAALLETNLSGASRATFSGLATTHQSELSGASRLVAKELATETTFVKASGASNAWVNTKQLKQELSGAAKVSYDNEPLTVEGKSDEAVVFSSNESHSGDTVNVNVGSVKVQVIDGDSTIVVVGSRRIVVDEKGGVKIERDKKFKFNGHWAGFELGINGLLTPDFDMSYPPALGFLDQRMEKSINVNLNFYEQNIRLNKKGNIGLVSGLGLTWNNYRFGNNVMLANENNQFKGYYMEGISVKKSKLVNTYLTLPLYLEFQTTSNKKKESAHFAAGVVAGWRFSSHTKTYFLESNKEYLLRDPSIVNSLPEVMRSPAASTRNIVKEHDSFQQTPFKLDASVRMGWGIVNLYANYALTPMFVKDRGPELYPFAVGITLSGW